MAEDKVEGREAGWRQLLPWAELFRGFQVALDLNKLLLAAAGILLMWFGWLLLAWIFGAGYEAKPPDKCPVCGTGQVLYQGMGTEKLQAEIEGRFAGKVVQRMDSDTMKRPGSHQKVLDAFRRGEIHILLGTQMIAKGLDFPNVTVVGVVNADVGLHHADFRASERTFQLLAQVAGRTGRGDLPIGLDAKEFVE